jgi:hypothetical protein
VKLVEQVAAPTVTVTFTWYPGVARLMANGIVALPEVPVKVEFVVSLEA